MHSIVLWLTLVLTHGEQVLPTPQGWLVKPTPTQVNLFTALEWGGLAVVSLIGIAWLVTMWRRAPQPARASWRMPVGSPGTA